MNQVSYTDVLARVKALAGVSDLTPTEEVFMTSLVNRRANLAYEASDFWPRWLVVGEKRNYQNTTVGATGLVSGSTYTILVVGNTNWVAVGASANTVGVTFVATGSGTGTGTATFNSNIIPYTQIGLSGVDAFLRIHKSYQPFYLYSSIEVEYYVDSAGAHVVGDTAPTTNTFVTYKKAWDGPYTPASVNVPGEWNEYICHGAYADFLRQDGQNEKALVEENVARGILEDQLMKVDVTRSTGVTAHRISTHVNRASRC